MCRGLLTGIVLFRVAPIGTVPDGDATSSHPHPRGIMLKHKFASGDRVSVLPDKTNSNLRPGIYTITRVLPVVGQECQYRARNALDTHERVLDETQLEAAPSLW